MSRANKVLTVSYGTFSCTLEGFDDSFEAMKSIAEYFRDLASDDRYFGAEPPQPDPQVLAKIAEKELARIVETRVDKGAVLLRPAIQTESNIEVPSAPDGPAQSEVPDLTTETEDKAPEITDTVPDKDLASISVDLPNHPAEFVEPTTEETSESVADKLKRIRGVVENDVELAPETVFTEDEHANNFLGNDELDIPTSEPSLPAKETSFAPEQSEPDISDDIKLLEPESRVEPSEGQNKSDSILSGDLTSETIDLGETPAKEAPGEQADPVITPDAEPSSAGRPRVIKIKKEQLQKLLAERAAAPKKEPKNIVNELDELGFSENPDADVQVDEIDLGEATVRSSYSTIDAIPEAPQPADAKLGDTIDDFDRLVSVTDQELNEPAGRSRRDAITQLRAAVAATKAEAQTRLSAEEDAAEFRGDLETSDIAAAPMKKASPLKLVASQRIDLDNLVEPPKVQMDDVSFEEFVERTGAISISDVLEAAAAYRIFIEEADVVTRWYMMKQAIAHFGEDFTREEGLQTIGQMLRDGTLVRIKPGNFRIRDQSPYNPQILAAG